MPTRPTPIYFLPLCLLRREKIIAISMRLSWEEGGTNDKSGKGCFKATEDLDGSMFEKITWTLGRPLVGPSIFYASSMRKVPPNNKLSRPMIETATLNYLKLQQTLDSDQIIWLV